MTMTDEIRKTLSDPKPLYALAGAGDLAAEKLKDAPGLAADAAQAVTTLAGRIAAEAPEQLAKVQALLAEVPAALDPKSARDALRESADKVAPQVLRERAQTIALTQVGRVLEAAGKAVETYDELAERGRAVVARYRGDEKVVTGVTVVVEQVVEEDVAAEAVFGTELADSAATASAPSGAFDEAAFEAAAYDRVREPGKEAKAGTDTAAEPKKSTASASTAKKTASTPRKRTASAKTAASPKSSASSAPTSGSGSSAAKPGARKTGAAKSTGN